MWNLTCRKTRRLLALSAGNDLDEREQSQAQRHLATCPHCREAWQRLFSAQQVLEKVRATPADGQRLGASIWPAVERQIRTIDEQSVKADWRGWLPAGALAAACLALVVIALPNGPSGDQNSPSVIFTQPVESQHIPTVRQPRPFPQIPLDIQRGPGTAPAPGNSRNPNGPPAVRNSSDDDRSF